MTALAEPMAVEAALPSGGGFWTDVLRRLRRNRPAWWSLLAVLALVVVAVGADVIAPYDSSAQFLAESTAATVDPLAARDTGKYEAPSREHVFGTDQLARDVFARTVYGLRISLASAGFAIVAVTLIGVAVGTLAAVGPRLVDDALMRLTDLAYAFPALLLVVLLRSALGESMLGRERLLGIEAGMLVLFFAISVASWPTMARLVRGQLLSIREMDHVMAAEAIGCSRARIALRHMLPLALGPVIVEATFLVPRAIAAEATLSFIGIGVTPPTPSLGVLIQDHFAFVGVQWTALAIPTGLLVVMFLAFQLLGDGLREALEPRSTRR